MCVFDELSVYLIFFPELRDQVGIVGEERTEKGKGRVKE